MDLVYTWKGCRKSGDCLDLFHRIIESRNNRNADHQSGLAIECNLSCILQHQSVGPSCEFLMFFLIHMLDIHQIHIQIGKNLFDLFPGGTGHTLHGCVDAALFCRAEKISGKICLAHAFSAGEGDSPSGAVIICTVFLNLFDHLTDSYIPADHFVLAQNFHILDPVFL